MAKLPKPNPKLPRSILRSQRERRFGAMVRRLYDKIGERMFVEAGVRKDYLVSEGHAQNLGELGSFMTELGNANVEVSKYAVRFLRPARRFLDKELQVTDTLLEACHRYVLTLYLYLGGVLSFDKEDECILAWEYYRGCPWSAFTAKKPFADMIAYVLRHTEYLREQNGRICFGNQIIEEGDAALYAQLDAERVPEMLAEAPLLLEEEVPQLPVLFMQAGPETATDQVVDEEPRSQPEKVIKKSLRLVWAGEELADPEKWPARLAGMDGVVKVVAEYYGTTPEVLRGPNINRPIAYARKILFFMMNMCCSETQKEIGLYLGGRSAPTVCLGSQAVRDKLPYDTKLASEITDLRNLLRAR